MVYNRQYNTRHSAGRYNTPGQFVAGGQSQQQTPQQPPVNQQSQQNQYNQQQNQQFQPPTPPQFAAPSPRVMQNERQHMQTPPEFPSSQALQSSDIDMKHDPDAEVETEGVSDDPSRPAWMKSKLPGVKKTTKKEKRRRQNEHLRRLITPKNALMVLNEMMLHDQLANQFKVEPSAEGGGQYCKMQKTSFCADLTLDGITYKGYGENKLTARNAAAEQAIRDLIIKRLARAADAAHEGSTAGASGGSTTGEEEDPLPMIQLASFALHKLFSEWEYEGHKVPTLKPNNPSTSEAEAEALALASPKLRPAKKPKELPASAAAMHPCMLLTYMRPHLDYRELAVAGDRPQNMLFTMGVDVDGATYIGKASNKKEARKAAARAACQALFGVQFTEPAPAAAAAAAPASASA